METIFKNYCKTWRRQIQRHKLDASNSAMFFAMFTSYMISVLEQGAELAYSRNHKVVELKDALDVVMESTLYDVEEMAKEVAERVKRDVGYFDPATRKFFCHYLKKAKVKTSTIASQFYCTFMMSFLILMWKQANEEKVCMSDRESCFKFFDKLIK